MEQIVECVPNFSEGRNKSIIDAISKSIRSVAGVVLLDVDPGEATNRTVVTFIGSPEAVKESAFQAIQAAAELIDMTNHTGAHARLGATDVCPFVPVRGVTMEDCAAMAREVGRRVAQELGIPVYLYENAASRPERKNLAVIREGEYEGLSEKLKNPDWAPDFGEPTFNPRSGATVIGAREFLIAYNVNLNTKDRKLASDIALDIREQGRAKRDSEGRIVRDKNGKAIKVAGRLEACKAVGWVIDEYQKAQVSINLTDYKVTPPHLAFETVREEARKRGLRATGSEIVGLVPLEAMLMAGRFYLTQQVRTTAVPEKELVRIAVESLGLKDVADFVPSEKIVDYQVMETSELMSMTLHDFCDELSTDSPAPGGGSVSALMGTLGGALVSMVASLAHGRKGMEQVKSEMEDVGNTAQRLKDRLAVLVDEDTRAFNRVIDAMRMKKKTDREKALRQQTIQMATKRAAQIPLEVAKTCMEVLELAEMVARKGNPNSVSDAGVAAQAAYAGVLGARFNVLINLPGIEDEAFRNGMTAQVEDLVSRARNCKERTTATVEKVIKEI